MGANFRKLALSQLGVQEPVPVEFGEWLPDIQGLNNPGGKEARGVIPKEKGYVPFKEIAPITGLTLPAKCRGAMMVEDRFGNARLYAATNLKLWVRTGSAFTNLYTPSPAPVDGPLWQFVLFGTDMVAFRLEVSPVYSSTDGSSPFVRLSNAPKAACGARVGDFLVLGNLDDEPDLDSARWPSRIRWSPFNDISGPWITDPATQSDFQDMPTEGGEVIAIAGREFGTIFQEKSISRMTYVGLPDVFDIETVEEARGAICTGGVVDIGALVYFIADDGFYVWNGTNTTPIGTDRVNRYFFSVLNYAERQRIVGSVDFENECIRWQFPTGGIQLDETIIYSYSSNRWSHVQAEYEYMFPAAVLPASIDDMLLNLDVDYLLSFDDNSYQTGRSRLAGFAANTHTFGLFVGAPVAARLETADLAAPGGRMLSVNNVRPMVDITTATMTLQAGIRAQLQGEAVSYSSAVSQEVTGDFSIIADARFMRFRLNIPAGAVWNHAQGLEVWRTPKGRR